SARLIDQGGTGLNQLLAHPMDRLHVLLGGTLDRDETHRRPARGLADRLGVTGVILVGFDERPYEPRRDQPHLVTELFDLTRPVMRARASLHRHQAAWQVGDAAQQLPPQEQLSQHRLPVRVAAVKTEHVLCQIDPQRSNLHLRILPASIVDGRSYHHGPLRPLSAGSGPSHQVPVARSEPRTRTALLLESIALRHQIAVLERSRTRRPCFRRFDRLFWILLSRWWPQW